MSFYTSPFDSVEVELTDLPPSLEVLSLENYNYSASLENLKSLSLEELNEMELFLFPSLENLTIRCGFRQAFVPQLKSLVSLSISVNDDLVIQDLPQLKELVVTCLIGTLALQDLASLKRLQLGRQ